MTIVIPLKLHVKGYAIGYQLGCWLVRSVASIGAVQDRVCITYIFSHERVGSVENISSILMRPEAEEEQREHLAIPPQKGGGKGLGVRFHEGGGNFQLRCAGT